MIQARLYDKKSSNFRDITIDADKDYLYIQDVYRRDRFDLKETTFSSRLGNTPRLIYLPNGDMCESSDNDSIDKLLKNARRDTLSSFLHLLEQKRRYFILALFITILSVYGFISYGLPILAKSAAQSLPDSVVYRIDESTLKSLDSTILKPSNLPQTRQQELSSYFLKYVDKTKKWPNIRIYFRSGKEIGPNAFALPDGTIVFTDELVKLAKDDRELLSVFFHELGHVHKRHALQTVLQDSSFYLLLSALVGDVTSAGSVFATLPTLLMQSAYSRDMEIEADDFAYDTMRSNHIDPVYFTAFMSRLMKTTGEDNGTVMQYLSDHPLTQFRIERFQQKANTQPIR